MTKETELILEKLDDIKTELNDIKGQVVTVDAVLTQDDIDALKESEADLKNKKTRIL